MNRFEVDSQVLKRPLIVLALVVLVGTALVWTSVYYKGKRVAALQKARAELGMAQDDYRLAVEADGILQTSHQRYSQLQQRGFVGDEPRLLWVELLRNTGGKHHLYNLQYSLHQRRAAQLEGLESTEHYQLYASTMQLQLELAHEVDLLRYLADLDRQHPAVYQVRGCKLKPLFEGEGVAFDKANVAASCDLLWFTVKDLASVEAVEEEAL